ncbi:hypothetical protein AKI39_09805 [Bordetella sp. H567]|nr:hypothetical protein AKI39_09805 [Bordetella sp. H567]
MAWDDASGVMLCRRDSGHGGRAIVLVHELGGSLDSWDKVANPLESQWRVLRYDQRGHGLAEKPRTPCTLDDQARDLGAVLAAAGVPLPCLLVGAAAGAAIVVSYALRHPDRVAGLVLCPPALGADPQRRAYLDERSRMAVDQGMRAVADASLANSYPPGIRRDAAAFDAYRARFLGCDPVGYAHANQALAHAELDGRLADLRCPVLVVAGRHDVLRPPAYARRIADAIPGARYTEIDSGHLMAVQAPTALAQAIAAHGATLSWGDEQCNNKA